MRTWQRAEWQKQCGLCGHPIYREQPMLVLRIAGVTRLFVRCRNCAGEPVPEDLPPLPIKQPKLPSPQPQRLGFERLSAIAPRDWKALQAKDSD